MGLSAILTAILICSFQDGKYSLLTEPDSEDWQAAVDYHMSRSIPRRFAVLTG